jgi:hypothetical protein
MVRSKLGSTTGLVEVLLLLAPLLRRRHRLQLLQQLTLQLPSLLLRIKPLLLVMKVCFASVLIFSGGLIIVSPSSDNCIDERFSASGSS